MALVLLDQLVKLLVRANIPLGGTVPLLPHVLSLTYTQNTGMAFSLFREHTWIITVVSAAVVVVMSALVVKGVIAGRWGRVSAMLVLAGGVGNLIDRVVFGYVTDMFRTEFMEFAVFNVADCCVTVGVVMLAVYLLFFYDKTHPAEDGGHDLPGNGR